MDWNAYTWCAHEHFLVESLGMSMKRIMSSIIRIFDFFSYFGSLCFTSHTALAKTWSIISNKSRERGRPCFFWILCVTAHLLHVTNSCFDLSYSFCLLVGAWLAFAFTRPWVYVALLPVVLTSVCALRFSFSPPSRSALLSQFQHSPMTIALEFSSEVSGHSSCRWNRSCWEVDSHSCSCQVLRRNSSWAPLSALQLTVICLSLT